MAHVVVFDRLAFQKVKLDSKGNRTIEPDGDEVVVTKGNYVPDWVPEWQLAAFAQSGMIVPVADRPEFEAGPTGVGPVPPEVPPAPGEVLPPINRGDQVLDNGGSWPDKQDAGQGDGTAVAPKESDNRAAWETYATSVGMDHAEVASYPNKGALIDAVNARTQK